MKCLLASLAEEIKNKHQKGYSMGAETEWQNVDLCMKIEDLNLQTTGFPVPGTLLKDILSCLNIQDPVNPLWNR